MVLAAAGLLAATLASAAEDAANRSAEGVAVAEDPGRPGPGKGGSLRGEVTNLPLPRFVSLRGREGNARRGPGLDHRIDWVFRHPGLPLMITAEYGNWRRVEDAEGMGGWVHYALLSGERTVIVTAPEAQLRAAPQADARIVARVEANAILDLDACTQDWCRLTARGWDGWMPRTDFWGVLPGEMPE